MKQPWIRAMSRCMRNNPPTLDMLPDGTFRRPPTVPFTTKLIVGAVLVAMVAGSIAVAVAALWVLSVILPVVIIAGGVAWLAMKWQRRSFGGQRDLRPRQPGGFSQ